MLLALACAEPPPAAADPCPCGSWGGGGVPDGAVLVPDDHATIGEALAAAGEGGTVAVAEGTYVENLSPPAGATIVGQCADVVTIDGSGQEEPTVEVSDGASLSGLTITGGYRGIRVIGGDLSGSDLVIRDNRQGGVSGVGKRSGAGSIRLDRTSVSGTRPGSPDDLGGIGLQVEGGYALELHDVLVDDNVLAGVNIYEGPEDGSPALTLDGGVIRGTSAQAGFEEFGFGLFLQLGATAEIDGLVVEDNYQYGVALINEGTGASARELSISGTFANGETGAALAVHTGASLECIDCTLSANQGTAVELNVEGRVRLERVAIADTSAYPSSKGTGVFANGGSVELIATTIDRTEGTGILVGNVATASLADVTISNGVSYAPGDTALLVQDSAVVEGAQVRVDGNEALGVRVVGPGASATLSDLTITNTVPDADGLAIALGSVDAAELDVVNLTISGATTAIFVEAASATIREARISDVAPVVDRSSVLSATEGSTVALTDAEIVDVEDLAVYARGSDLQLTRVTLEDVRSGAGLFLDEGATAIGSDVSMNRVGDLGVSLSAGSVAELTGFDFRDGVVGETYGVALGAIVTGGSVLRITDGVIDGALGDGVLVSGSSAEFTSVTISGTEPALDGSTGTALAAHGGAEVSLSDCLFEDNVGYGLYVFDGASAVVTDTTVTRTRLPEPPYARAVGVVVAEEGSRLDASGLHATENEGVGALVLLAAEFVCSDCTVSDNVHQNIGILDATVRLSESSVCGGADLGILAGSGDRGTVLEVSDSEICGHELAGAYLWGGTGRYSFTGVTMTAQADHGRTKGPWGEAVVAVLPAAPYEAVGGTTLAGLTVEDGEIVGNGTRPPVFLAGAGASFCGNTIDAGAVEEVRTQSGGEVSACEDLSVASDKTSTYEFYTIPVYDTPIQVAGD